MAESNKTFTELKKEVVTSLSPEIIERINSQTSEEPFKWNINSAFIFTIIFSQLLTWFSEFYTTGQYTKLWIFILAVGAGYCVYMLGIVLGSCLSFKLRMQIGKNLTPVEQILAANSLLESSRQEGVSNFAYSSHHFLENKTRGFVFVVSSSEQDDPTKERKSEKEKLLVKKIRDNLIELHSLTEDKEKR